jgi:hypothetical protein
MEEPDAVQELGRRIKFLTPQAFLASEEITLPLLAILSNAASSDDCALSFSHSDFSETYKSASSKFLRAHPRFTRFSSKFALPFVEAAARRVFFLASLQIIPESRISPILQSSSAKCYDELSLLYCQVIEAFRPIASSKTGSAPREWSAIVAATFFISLQREFPNSELRGNVVFFVKLETFIINLIVRFASLEDR